MGWSQIPGGSRIPELTSGKGKKRSFEIGIRARLVIIFMTILLFSGLLIGATSYFTSKNLADEQIRSNLETRAEDWMNIVDSYVEEVNSTRDLVDQILIEDISMTSNMARGWMESFDQNAGGPGLSSNRSMEIVYNRIENIELEYRGDIFILGTIGESKGRYIVPDEGENKGDLILDRKDPSGHYYIREIVENGTITPSDPYTTEHNIIVDGEIYEVLFSAVYYEPWDALIVASIHLEDQRTENEIDIMERLKSRIAEEVIGKTGYIWVLQGSGDSKGTYIVSQNRVRDGENLWNVRDSEGNFFVREMVEKGKQSPEDAFFYSYQWKNPGEDHEREKIAAIVYVEEWDWVIGASAYHSEFLDDVYDMRDTLVILIVLELLLTLGAAFAVGTYYARTITRPLRKLTKRTEEVREGRYRKEKLEEGLKGASSEIRTLARSFDEMGSVISQRDEARRKLMESESRFRELANVLPEIVYEADTNGTITYFNHNGLKKFGYSKEEVIGKMNLIDLVVPEQKKKGIERLRNLKKGMEPRPMEYNARRKNGTEFPMIAHTAAQVRRNGEVTYRGVLVDITNRKRTERLVQEERTKAEFYLDMLGHDIGNLHMGLGTSLELAKRSKSPERQKQALDIAGEAIKKSMKLTDNVMLLSRIRSERTMLERIDIKKSLEEAVEQIRTTYPEDDLSIHIHGTSKRINAEPIIKELFFNLIHNAVKVQADGEKWVDITIKDSSRSDWIRIDIADKGHGIPDREKERIFKRFWTSGKASRIGLGLSLVKALVDRYNGELSVEDRVKGDHSRGTVFVVEFPRI